MRINNNYSASNNNRQIGINNDKIAKNLEKLSSGRSINRAGDNAAGLAISEKLRGQIRSLDQASRNTQDGISMLQTAEGGLQEINNMVIRIRELVTQAANDSNVSLDRAKIHTEVSQLRLEISDMGVRTEFNTMSLLNLSGTTSKDFQIGANNNQKISFEFSDVNVNAKVWTSLSTISDFGASGFVTSTIAGYLSTIDSVLGNVTEARAKLGATINRLEYTNKSVQISSENLSAAESRIRDTDMAKEMMKLTQANILQQAGVSMLAQANMAPQSVLQLLQ